MPGNDTVGLRILLVEDNPGDRDLVIEYLEMEEENFTAEFASTMEDALDRLKQSSFDLILLDLGLPDSQGMETISMITGASGMVPVIALTGREDDEISRNAIKSGAQDYLVKGKIAPEQLTRSIRYAIERKNAENELAAIYENAPVLMMLLDGGLKIRRANKMTQMFAGKREAELVGLECGQTLSCVNVPAQTGKMPCECCELRKGILRTFESGISERNVESKLSVSTNDGPRGLYISASASRIMSGAEPMVLLCIQDITQKVEALDNLRRSEAFLNATGKMAKVGGWELDTLTGKLSWTDVTYDIHEMPLTFTPGLEEAISFFHPDDAPQVRQALKNAVEKGEPYDLEVRFVTANGRKLWTHTKCVPVFSDGKVIRLIGTFQDVTERKSAEDERLSLENQFRQAQKMEAVGRLAGGVAHDFNNMLGVILGNTEMAILKLNESDSLHADLVEIRKAAERSTDLTRQLLAFARRQAIAPKVLDINDTVEGMLKMLRRLIGENITLSWLPGVNLWPLMLDPSQLDQILANLCVNARDAIDGIGKVVIETAQEVFDKPFCAENAGFIPGDFVRLAVSDNGCGMDSQTLLNIFEPFFTTKGVGKGTGLGLATVYGIVRQNNGFIKVLSEQNGGTTFNIYLPRYRGKEKMSGEKAAAAPVLGGNETILLVEDEPAILSITKTMLKRQGYNVLEAQSPSAAEAIAKQHTGTIDLLMTDVIMPEMNGQDLANQLAAIHPGMKKLFVSGYTADVIANQGVLEEGLHFLQKPFSMKDLSTKVREVLDRN